MVLPDGTIKDFNGSELDLISDAEGTTGLISEITIKVMPYNELDVTAVSFRKLNDLQKFLQTVQIKIFLYGQFFLLIRKWQV